jgi:hypothetical protein
MNVTRPYNYIVVSVLIILSLVLPGAGLAALSSLESGVSSEQSAAFHATTTTPDDTCPCSGGPGSDCCDTSFCNCGCHAPLSQGVRLVYAPVMAVQTVRELFRPLPQVYFSIFVPPQNPA